MKEITRIYIDNKVDLDITVYFDDGSEQVYDLESIDYTEYKQVPNLKFMVKQQLQIDKLNKRF